MLFKGSSEHSIALKLPRQVEQCRARGEVALLYEWQRELLGENVLICECSDGPNVALAAKAYEAVQPSSQYSIMSADYLTNPDRGFYSFIFFLTENSWNGSILYDFYKLLNL